MEWATSELLYQHVSGDPDTDPRLKRSFERIKLVCDEISEEVRTQAKRGALFSSSPIFVAEVGRRCKKKFGGPSAESITRNRRTEPLKAMYIQLRAEELDVPARHGKSNKRDHLPSEPSVRAYILSLEARIKANDEIILGLTSSMKKMRAISLDEALAASTDDADQLEVAAGLRGQASHQELVRVIRRLIDPQSLMRFGLKRERCIFNPATGEELLTSAEVDLLEEIIRVT